MQSDTRSWLAYAGLAVGIVARGLLWRSHLLTLSPFTRKYDGDALWAALVLVLIRFCRPRMTIVSGSILAFGIAVAVEFSQLYHAPWIDAIRGTRLGLLIIGSTFNWPDIAAYALGILTAASLDRITGRHPPASL